MSANGIEELRVTTHNGRIEVIGDPAAEQFTWTAFVRAGGSSEDDATDALAAIETFAELDEDGKALQIGWRWSASIRPPQWAADVHFAVTTPPRPRVRTETHNGRITVTGAANGLTARSHNGRVSATLDAEPGAVDIETHNGRITVGGAIPELRAESHNGRIEANLTSASIDGVSLHTHNGRVLVRLPQDASMDLDVETDNGSVSTDFGLIDPVVEKSSIRARVGNGGGKLEARTHNGSIRVEKIAGDASDH